MKKLSVYILLDRSGSMQGNKWESAIGSVNGYVETLRKDKTKAEITVVAFDSERIYKFEKFCNFNSPFNRFINKCSFDIIRNNVNIKSFLDIGFNEISPRGGTPLYDATGKLLDMAEANGAEKTVIIIITDGEENTSIQYNNAQIKKRVEDATLKGWEVIFMGADFNADNIAKSYGLGLDKVLNSSPSNFRNTMNYFATASSLYANGAKINTTSAKDVVAGT